MKILQFRKRLGLKEIEAPSLEVAESSLIEILCDYLNLNFSVSKNDLKKCIYIFKDANQRKLLLFFQPVPDRESEKLSIEIKKV